MKVFGLAVMAALLFGAPAQAQRVMAQYDTRITQQDLVNSRGARLGTVCAIIQQDRANYHRFGRADAQDMGDPVFANATLRGRISNTCEFAAGYGYLRDVLLSGQVGLGIMLRITVLDDQGQMRVVVAERAG